MTEEKKPVTQVENLQQENAALKAAASQRAADELTIKAKMAAGLTREQAEAVIRNQRAFDARKTDLGKRPYRN